MNTSALKTTVGVGVGLVVVYVIWKATALILPALVIGGVGVLGWLWWKGGQKSE
jgi:hypothetical protein